MKSIDIVIDVTSLHTQFLLNSDKVQFLFWQAFVGTKFRSRSGEIFIKIMPIEYFEDCAVSASTGLLLPCEQVLLS